jgi:hypothetical protein
MAVGFIWVFTTVGSQMGLSCRGVNKDLVWWWVSGSLMSSFTHSDAWV